MWIIPGLWFKWVATWSIGKAALFGHHFLLSCSLALKQYYEMWREMNLLSTLIRYEIMKWCWLSPFLSLYCILVGCCTSNENILYATFLQDKVYRDPGKGKVRAGPVIIATPLAFMFTNTFFILNVLSIYVGDGNFVG